MICDCCRRKVDYFRGSFWHGDTRICRECFAQWCDLDNDSIEADDPRSIGNYVRLKNGLPPIAAALVILLVALTSTAYAARYCLDRPEAVRIWPMKALAKDHDGCWAYDHHPPRAEVPIWVPETILPGREPMPMDGWPAPNLLEVELRELEPESVSQPTLLMTMRHLASFVSLVLAAVAVVGVAVTKERRSALAVTGSRTKELR